MRLSRSGASHSTRPDLGQETRHDGLPPCSSGSTGVLPPATPALQKPGAARRAPPGWHGEGGALGGKVNAVGIPFTLPSADSCEPNANANCMISVGNTRNLIKERSRKIASFTSWCLESHQFLVTRRTPS